MTCPTPLVSVRHPGGRNPPEKPREWLALLFLYTRAWARERARAQESGSLYAKEKCAHAAACRSAALRWEPAFLTERHEAVENTGNGPEEGVDSW